MIKFFSTSLLLFALFQLCSQEVISTSFSSASLNGETIPLKIYLPVDYNESNDPYRLYIFLHGCCGLNQNSHTNDFKTMLDQKIANGEIDPMIVVFPSAQGADFGNRHIWLDSERNGNYGSMIVQDLTTWLGANYNVAITKEKRAVGGFSMGADGALRLGLHFSDQFIALVSHSSYPAIENFESVVPAIIAETGQSNPPYTFEPGNGLYTEAVFGISSAFSPNLDNAPYLLDFPIDENGNVIEEVHNRWRYIASPDSIIRWYWGTGSKVVPVAMYVDIGSQESLFTLYPTNLLIQSQLENLELNEGFDINYTFNIFNENHDLSLVRIDSSLVWLDRIMDAATITATTNPRESQEIFSVFPTIISSDVKVIFHQEIKENNALIICDSSGKIITVYENMTPAIGEIWSFPTDQLVAGVYWICLRNGKDIIKKQVVKI